MIYLVNAEGEPTPFEEEDIPTLMKSGVMTPEMHCWKEGMEEWRPLGELFPTRATQTIAPPRRDGMEGTFPPAVVRLAAPAATEAPTEPARRDRSYVAVFDFRYSPLILTVVLSIALTACLINEGWLTSLEFSRYALLQDPSTSSADDLAVRETIETWSYVHMGLFFLTAIPFTMWVYQAYKNSRGFVPGLRFSAQWAAGFYFVPIVNLFRPYQVMQDIWRVSSHPNSWSIQPGSIFVGIWWGIWLAVALASRLATYAGMQLDTGVESRIHVLIYFLVYYLLYCLLCAVDVALIWTIVAKQRRLVNSGKS